MANTRSGRVVYVPHPNPHPQTKDAPRTGVPVNPVPAKGLGNVSTAKHLKDFASD